MITWWLYTHFFFFIQKTEQINYLNDINCCFSWCDKNFSISKIRQSALHEQTHLRWLNKVSLLRRTNKLLLRELKSLTASSCLIFYTFATIYFWVLTKPSAVLSNTRSAEPGTVFSKSVSKSSGDPKSWNSVRVQSVCN